jgi:alkylhydroperoxidase family enzyme
MAKGGREDRDGGRPAWIRTVGPDEADDELADVYRRIGARDRADHVIRVHSLHPEGMEGHVRLYRSVMFGRSPLSRREREAVAVVVSAANDCFY